MVGRTMTARQVVLCLSLLLHLVNGYKSGAPNGVCGTMTPKHKEAVPQTNQSPFTVSVSPDVVRPGGIATVKLSSPPGKTFKGFLIKGLHPSTNETLGSFISGEESHTINCHDGTNNAITHNSNKEKTSQEILWTAPRNYAGNVVFRTTFVESGFVFWVNVTPTAKLSISGSPVENVVTDPPAPFQSVYDDCFITKGCFGGPKGCIATRSCFHLVSYELNNDTIDFDMVGLSKGWIGVGFSKDNQMGEDAVTVCAINASNSKVSVFQTWNLKDNNEVLENPEMNLRETSGSVQDGYIHCHFSHKVEHKPRNVMFNFLNESYYLFLGRGMMKSVVPPVELEAHENLPYQTAVPVDLKQAVEVQIASDILMKLHGSLMTVAWVGTVSIAIFVARYYKQTWATKTMCGQKVWFTWHRVLNVATILLSSAGFVIIFVHLQDWSKVWQSNPHPILGVITVGLMWIQPFMAALRCHPGTPKRYIFNWFHFIVGNSAHISAVITLFFAKWLDKAKLPDFYLWILIAFVGFHVIIFFTMETFTCFRGKASNANQIAMKDMASNGNSYHMTDGKKDAPGSRFRKVILSIYVFGNICFVAALVFTVFVSPVKER